MPQSALHVITGVDNRQVQREEGLLRRQNPNILPGESVGMGEGPSEDSEGTGEGT